MFAHRPDERNVNIRRAADCAICEHPSGCSHLGSRPQPSRLGEPTHSGESRTDVDHAIRRRRACRDYLPDPIPYDVLEQLADAAQRAPTASNVPYRHVLIVDDPSVVRAIRQISAALLADPPALLILLTDVRMAVARVGRIGHLSSAIDSGAAGENVWLLATELGLGTQFTMISAAAGIGTVLDLPEHIRVDLIMPVGRPRPGAASRPLPRARTSVSLRRTPVHANQWGSFRGDRASS